MGMTKILYLLLSFILIFAITACQGEKAQDESQTEATVEKALDENMAECAAGCDMAMEKEKMIAVEQDGDTLYFCSEKCRDEYFAAQSEEGAEEEGTESEDES